MRITIYQTLIFVEAQSSLPSSYVVIGIAAIVALISVIMKGITIFFTRRR